MILCYPIILLQEYLNVKRCGFENQIFPEKEIKTNLKQRQKLKR